jgi:hypothetical protein
MFTPNSTFSVEWDHIFLDNTSIAIIDSRDTVHRDFDKVLFGIQWALWGRFLAGLLIGAAAVEALDISTTCLPQLKHNSIRHV